MQRFQSWVLACRQFFMRVDVVGPSLTYRPVGGDYLLVEPMPARPSVPGRICELHLRELDGKPSWCWEIFDVRDPLRPVWRITEAGHAPTPEEGIDRTADALEPAELAAYATEPYPWRRQDGTPILPYVCYAAELLTDRIWDAFEGIETRAGAMMLGVGHTMLYHLMRDCSWPQRWVFNMILGGQSLGSGPGEPRAEVETDPAVVLSFDVAEEGTQPMVGQWEPGGDVAAFEEVLRNRAMSIAQDAGITSGDIQRAGGNARSGQAIALNHSEKREAQAKYAPSFHPSDVHLLEVSAIVANSRLGTTYPETGYEVAYAPIPLTPDEQASRRQHVLERLAAGLMSRVEAYRYLNPGLSVEQALVQLAAIDAETTPEVAENVG